MNVTSLLIVFYLSHLIQSPEKIRKLAKMYRYSDIFTEFVKN